MRSLLLSLVASFTLQMPTIAADGGLFVAVGYAGRRISSTDGATWQHDQRWSDTAADDDNVLFNIAHGLGRFVAVGGGAAIGHIVTTKDGKTWEELPQVKGRVATIAFGNGRFIAGHGNELLYSTDGTTFQAGAKLGIEGSVHARRSAFGGGEAGPRVVIIGEVDQWTTKTRVGWRATTEDGTRMTSVDVETPMASDVAFGSGHFVIVGPKGLIESSHDGHTWKRHAAPETEVFSRVAWTGSRFLVTGGSTTWSSPDALHWSAEKKSIPGGIAWAREGFLGLSLSWGGNIHVSKDLLEWKKSTIPPGPSLEAIAYGKP
ncbi:MAG TPA: hypothetical protein VF614_00110 [Chthoniobacteraceae bacterium]|jgi:hypothetical protein